MDIWHWLHGLENDLYDAGQVHNATIIDKLSTHVAQKEVANVEALLPEVKALAHTLKNPWLNVYAGHWEMRNRIGNQKEGESALADVVSLFEYAHRDETIDCPQSVCITQDLTTCYANIDGAGWAEERIAVCDETLARLDPSWNCYQCITCEKAMAMLDQGRIDDAKQCLDNAVHALEEAGEEVYDGIKSVYNDVYFEMGDYQTVLDNIQQLEQRELDYPEWEKTLYGRAIDKTKALAYLGRDDEALEALPPIRDNVAGDWHGWLCAIYPVLERRPNENSWQLAHHLQKGLDHLSAHGSHRKAIEMAILCSNLAILRGVKWVAMHTYHIAHRHLDKLKADFGATQKLAELKHRIDQMSDIALPVPSSELSAYLDNLPEDEPRNPEMEVQWLTDALQEQPLDEALTLTLHGAYLACGMASLAIKLLFDGLVAADIQSFKHTLLDTLISQNDPQGVHKLSHMYAEKDPAFSLWCLARLAYHQDNWHELLDHTTKLLDHHKLDDNLAVVQKLHANALTHLERFDEAKQVYEAMHKADPDPRHLWEKLIVETCAKDWQAVISTAKTLDIEMEGDGSCRPDEDWGIVIIQIEDDGDVIEYFARRLGATHAQIIENAPAHRSQHYGEIVVFHPRLIYPYPESEAEQDSFIPTFAHVYTLESSDYQNSFYIDGVFPGQEAIETIKQAALDKGWHIFRHDNDYTVTDSTTDTKYSGVLLTLAIKTSDTPLDACQFLEEQTADFEHSLCFYNLAQKAGRDTSHHEALIQRYGL